MFEADALTNTQLPFFVPMRTPFIDSIQRAYQTSIDLGKFYNLADGRYSAGLCKGKHYNVQGSCMQQTHLAIRLRPFPFHFIIVFIIHFQGKLHVDASYCQMNPISQNEGTHSSAEMLTGRPMSSE